MVKKSFKASIQDKRFEKIYSDPRFRTLAKKERKIQLDPRFQSMFTSPEFQMPVAQNVDERGKKVTEVSNPLTRVFDTAGIQCIDEEGNFKWEVQSSSSSEEQEEIQLGTELYVEEPVKTGDETLRIAVMNCDWTLIKAVDILAILRSFAPGVEKVSIYPSEFGKERMENEEKHGPALMGGELDEEALRRYELETMKYYYAVAEFDCLETARRVYDDCDALEIERTSNVLDLRFVPDELKFPYDPTDVATQVPKQYKMLDYYTKALQQSRVSLTWDETPRDRVATLRNAFNSEDMDEDQVARYVATPSPVNEDSEELSEEEDMPRYSGKVSQFNKMNQNMDLEIKFHSGFEQIGKDMLKDDKDLSVWDKHLEKKKKKKKLEKEQRKLESGNRHVADRKVDKKSIENLQMLVDNKGDVPEFKFNSDDDRFKQLYSDNLYGIDPTSNSYKIDPDGNKLMLNMQIQKRKRNS